MLDLPVYLDNHATTRTDPRVVEAMLPYFTTLYGNAASVSHRFGWDAAAAVERAREQVAAADRGGARGDRLHLGGDRGEQPGASRGPCRTCKRQGNHLVTAATEHKAVLDPMKRLAREGWDADDRRPATRTAWSRPRRSQAALTDRTVLVSVMAANNEVGTLNPIAAIGRLCHDAGHPLPHRRHPGRRQGPARRRGATRSICSASRHIRFMAPRGSAPCTSAAATRRSG